MEREESILRSVALKAAVERWKDEDSWGSDTDKDVLKSAERFLSWLQDKYDFKKES